MNEQRLRRTLAVQVASVIVTEPLPRFHQHGKMTRVHSITNRILGNPLHDHTVQPNDTQLVTTNILVRVIQSRLLLRPRRKTKVRPRIEVNVKDRTYTSSPVRLSTTVFTTVATDIKLSTKNDPTFTLVV